MNVTSSATERILILGTNPLTGKIAETIAAAPMSLGIVGLLHDDCNTGGVLPRSWAAILTSDPVPGNDSSSDFNRLLNHSGTAFPIIGPFDRLDNAIMDLRPDRIVVSLSDSAKLPAQALLNWRIKGLPVEDGNAFCERLQKKLAIESLPPSLLIFSKDLERPRSYRALRRAFNLATAATALVAAAPLMLVIAILIKLGLSWTVQARYCSFKSVKDTAGGPSGCSSFARCIPASMTSQVGAVT
jgi:hypothetical protein